MIKNFKLVLYDWDKTVHVLFLLILLWAEANLFSKKVYGKRNFVRAFNFSNGKVILIFLTKVVVIHMGFSVVYI